MNVVLLGTTGYHPSDQRHTMCIMVPDCGLVLDAGTAMYRVRDYATRPELDICLTHTHLDHVIGLTFLFSILHRSPIETVRVHGQEEKLAAVREHLFSADLFPALPPMDWVPLTDPVELPESARLSWFPLAHPGGSLGYRLDVGSRSLAYVTDTTAAADADYISRISGVDLLIHECNFPDGWEDQARLTGHSCLSSVLEVARRAHVGQLVLVHMNPLLDDQAFHGDPAVAAIFPNAVLGTDRMQLEL